MATEFSLDPTVVGRIEQSAAMREALRHTAAQVADTARAIAPVGTPDEPDDNPGRFQASIRAEDTAVVSDDPAARFIIFGTSRTPPHDTLMRAAEMHGLKPARE